MAKDLEKDILFVAEDEDMPTAEEITEAFPKEKECCCSNVDALIKKLSEKVGELSVDNILSLRSVIEEYEQKHVSAKDRVYNEAIDLGTKIDKLERFIVKRNIDGIKQIEAMKLTEAAKYLLYEQLDTQKKLYNILVARYSIFDCVAEDEEEVKEDVTPEDDESSKEENSVLDVFNIENTTLS